MPPLSLMIKPASSRCNMHCTYCFYADVTSHRQTVSYGVMSEAVLEKLLARAFAFAEGSLSLSFQGGEPTLAGKDFFRALLRLERQYSGHRLSIQHSIQTNGYALDEEWMEIFREGRFLVGLSLDGTEAIHNRYRLDGAGRGTYARIQNTIRLLREYKIEYNILCVVTQDVALHAREVFRALQPHCFLQFVPCLDGFDGKSHGWSLTPEAYGRFLIETYDLYEQAMFTRHPVSIRHFDNWISMLLGYPPDGCAMAGQCGHYFLVEADGGVYPCDFYVLDEWRLGNLGESSFLRLDRSPLAEKFRASSHPLPDACHACPYLFLCRGGCRRDREPVPEGEAALNRLCAGHRLFFDARLERMKALAGRIAAAGQGLR